ncbi:MAG: hypothetical protein ABSG57_12610 [Candidatus Bathyarchaeia archaeon]|jgi:hypothetical protein
MKVPIRMITVATSFFWIILIIFSVSAIYSMKDIRLDLGRPQITITPDNELVLSFPIGIVNNGYYNLDDLNISTEIQDVQNSTMAQGFTFIPVIEKAETLNTTHQMRINLTDTLQTHQYLIFNDTELQVPATVTMKAAELISLQVSSNLTIPWGAPLYNLTFGTPKFTLQISPNSTRFYRVTIPTAFENHASFDLNGTIQLGTYNNRNILTWTAKIVLNAPRQSTYQADLNLDVPVADVSTNGRFEAFFETSFLNYGPLVIPYGS